MTVPAMTQFGGRVYNRSVAARDVVNAAQARARTIATGSIYTAEGFLDAAQQILNELEITTSTVENSWIFKQVPEQHRLEAANQLRAIRGFMENTQRKVLENKDLIMQPAVTEYKTFVIMDIKENFRQAIYYLKRLENICPGLRVVA